MWRIDVCWSYTAGLSGTKDQAVEDDMRTVGSLAELVLVIELTLLVSLMMLFKISISTYSAALLGISAHESYVKNTS